MQLKKLNDMFEDPYTLVDLFKELRTAIEGWENFTKDNLEAVGVLYVLNRLDKHLSPIVIRFIGKNLGLSDVDKTRIIAVLINSTYNNSFVRLYKALFTDYNPLNNYEMVESGNDVKELTDNTTDTINKQTKDNTTKDFENIVDGETQTEIKKNGFNISNPVTDTVETVTEDTTTTNTETVERSENETRTGQSDKTVKETNTHNFTRSGNIGVTTSQQMIESEIVLRQKEYWDIVFKKIDELLFLSIY